MPRDNDKNNDSRGRRDRPGGGKGGGRGGGKGRSGAARGPEKKFAKRGFAGKGEGEKRPSAGRSEGARSYDKKPYAGGGKPYAGKREGAAPRRDRDDGPRPQRFNRDDSPRGEKRAYPRDDRGREGRPRPARRCPSGLPFPGPEIRRQETLRAPRGRRREAAVHPAR